MSCNPCTQTLFVGESHSSTYAKFRPTPPLALINKIISYVQEKIPGDLGKAADVGCGTGQGTQILGPYFQHVTGFDISDTQVNEATEQNKDMPNITYCTSPAETLPVADQSLQLVTVSQAVHWFNIPEFFKEVNRILVPNGVCAIYAHLVPLPTPGDPAKTKEVQDMVQEFYEVTLQPFWSEKKMIFDNKYQDIELPEQYFTDNIRDETVVNKKALTLGDYTGLLSSWSAFQQMKLQDPERANKELCHVMDSIANIIGDKNKDPSEIPLTMHTNYVLLMARKKE